MKNWKSFLKNKIDEGRFDNVNLGASSMEQRIAAMRRNIADTLQELVDSKELDPNATVTQAIAILRG